MRILYHHRTRAGDAQGVHIAELVAAFREIGHATDVVSLVTPAPPPGSSKGEPLAKRFARTVPFFHEVLQCGYNAAAVPWLLWKIARFRPDFLYERYSLFNFAGVLSAALAGRPLVLEVNSPLAFEQHGEKEIRAHRFSQWMEKIICNAATKVVVVSNPLRRIMAAEGVADSKLEVVHNGVNLAHFRQLRDAARLRSQWHLEGRTVIGFAGWFRSWHRVDLLMEAFAQAGLAQQGASLLLVGDGPETAALRATAERLGIKEHSVFTGPIPHHEIPAYMNLFDIAVQPAANAYCCPMKILEYMGLGKAIVAPRQENIEELLVDEHEALLFPSGDGAALALSLQVLLRDPERRQSLGESARGAIERRGLLWHKNAEAVIRMIAGASAAGNHAQTGTLAPDAMNASRKADKLR